MKKLIYVIILAISVVAASCEQNDIPDNIITDRAEGEWIVKAYVNGKNIYSAFPIRTYTSVYGKDSIYINDFEGSFWNFNVKASIKNPENTFQTLHSVNTVSGNNIGIKMQNGRIINNDSIYFEIQFEDDETPYGVTYQLAGHRTK